MIRHENSLNLLTVLSQMSDEQWFETLVKSIENPIVNGVELPGFPPDQFQTVIVGSSGKQALQEAFNFYREVKHYASGLALKFDNSSRILDFGCGWGRIIRFFLKDINSDNLYGVDVDPGMIDICNKHVRCGNYSVVNPEPPTEFPNESMDVIYAYSVFSHLAEPIHIKWIEEFSRILKPGGMLVVTTMARYFIEYCQSLQGRTHESEYHNALAKSFVETQGALDDYDNGKFLYSAIGGGPVLPGSFYGIALIPRAYVEKEWTKFLTFIDFVDDRTRLPQAMIVMKKSLIDFHSRAEDIEVAIEERDVRIKNLEFILKDKENTLSKIYSSRGWKLLLAYYKIRDKLLGR